MREGTDFHPSPLLLAMETGVISETTEKPVCLKTVFSVVSGSCTSGLKLLKNRKGEKSCTKVILWNLQAVH